MHRTSYSTGEIARVHECARLGIRFHADPGQIKNLSTEIKTLATPAADAGEGEESGEFGVGIKPNPKARAWQERANFWREQAFALGWREKRDAANGEVESLLGKPGPLPVGCHCKPGQCAAPVVMGRQTACRDPAKAGLRDAHENEPPTPPPAADAGDGEEQVCMHGMGIAPCKCAKCKAAHEALSRPAADSEAVDSRVEQYRSGDRVEFTTEQFRHFLRQHTRPSAAAVPAREPIGYLDPTEAKHATEANGGRVWLANAVGAAISGRHRPVYW